LEFGYCLLFEICDLEFDFFLIETLFPMVMPDPDPR